MANITLEGNLGNNPEKMTASNGKEFIRLSIGEQRSYLDKETDEYVDVGTDWHTVFIFSPNVKAHALNMRKGARVKINGTLSYQVDGKTEAGHDNVTTSIIAHRIESKPLVKKAEKSAA